MRNLDVIVMIILKLAVCWVAIVFTRCSTASIVNIFFILRPNNIFGVLLSGRAMLYYILDARLFLQTQLRIPQTFRVVSLLRIISLALERTPQRTVCQFLS